VAQVLAMGDALFPVVLGCWVDYRVVLHWVGRPLTASRRSGDCFPGRKTSLWP
jgi:hypothetical protein